MKVKLLLHLRALLFFQIILFTASAQNRTITGTVISKATGQPLPGATVLIKGTRTATTTDNSGNFTINVLKQNWLLAISYIGMASQELVIPASGTVSVQLEETITSKLDEV